LGRCLACEVRFELIDDTLDEAVDKNKCFKITYARPVGGRTIVTHFSTNNGEHCKD
jgi:hypothetical protein